MTIETNTIGLCGLLREFVGVSWDSDSGKFVQCGKFKDKPTSADSFIGKLRESSIGICADSEIWERFRGILGTEFCAIGSVDNFPRFVLESYLNEFPIPFTLTQGSGIHPIFEKFRPGSCMRYEECYDMRRFYVKNRDIVGTVHWELGSHELLISSGSFLVWFDESENRMLRDRIYSSSYLPFVNQLLPNRADKMLREWFPDYSDIVDLRATSEKIALKGLTFHGELFPWMDSLCYGNLEEDGSISLYNWDKCGTVELQDSNGTDIEGDDDRADCCNCGYRGDIENMHSPECGDGFYCSECYSEHFSYSEYDGNDYPCDDVTSVTILDRRGRERDTTISHSSLSEDFREYAGDYWDSVEYVHFEIGIETESGNWIAPEDCTMGGYDTTGDDCDSASYLVPWGTSTALNPDNCYYWEHGNRKIPVGNPVPVGFYPRNPSEQGARIGGQFVKKFGENLVIVFDSTGDKSHPYSVGIRNPRKNFTISNPSLFRFVDESIAVTCLRALSSALATNPEKRDCVYNWDGISSVDYAWLANIVNMVASELGLR